MKMILFMSLLTCFSIGFSQSLESSIKEIREKYKKTRADYPNLQKNKSELTNFNSTEGGEMLSYSDKSGVRLIEVIYYGEMGKRVTEYYFEEEKLYFVFNQTYHYNSPIYFDEKMAEENGGEAFDIKKSTIEEDRYYFEKNKLIRWLDLKKEQVDLQSDIAKTKAKQILSDSSNFWDILH